MVSAGFWEECIIVVEGRIAERLNVSRLLLLLQRAFKKKWLGFSCCCDDEKHEEKPNNNTETYDNR